MAGADGGERGDAARNRAVVLEAARDFVAKHGVDALTMDALAQHAGVGKGTIFRRFGSRAGLMVALLDHSEKEFQRSFMFGPPPLGPGAPAVERLVAFGIARIGIVETHGELQRAADASTALRYAHPTRRLVRRHLSMLLAEAGVKCDADLVTYQLMATLDAELLLYLRRVERMPLERLADGWADLVRRVTA
jgi:AcrR family transcriptional regulator